MKTIKRSETFDGSPEEVFKSIDDLGITGMHMKRNSPMMMGSKLNLEFLSVNKTGLGTKYRWFGKIMGTKVDFTVEVTKWIPGVEKIWETIGESKLIIYSWYRMHLILRQGSEGTLAELSISYERPSGWFNKIISILLADWYCEWCLNKMLGDARAELKIEVYNTR